MKRKVVVLIGVSVGALLIMAVLFYLWLIGVITLASNRHAVTIYRVCNKQDITKFSSESSTAFEGGDKQNGFKALNSDIEKRKDNEKDANCLYIRFGFQMSVEQDAKKARSILDKLKQLNDKEVYVSGNFDAVSGISQLESQVKYLELPASQRVIHRGR